MLKKYCDAGPLITTVSSCENSSDEQKDPKVLLVEEGKLSDEGEVDDFQSSQDVSMILAPESKIEETTATSDANANNAVQDTSPGDGEKVEEPTISMKEEENKLEESTADVQNELVAEKSNKNLNLFDLSKRKRVKRN